MSSQWHRGAILWPGKRKGGHREQDWGCDSLGRERPKSGAVRGLPGTADGCGAGGQEAGTCSAAGTADLDTQL